VKDACATLIQVEPVTKAQEGILKISVKDSGIGISKESLNKLFNKFSQVSSKEKRQSGSGLGLYITKEICQKMGGEIRAYSQPGVGSTFVVCIPTHCSPEFDKEYDFNMLVQKLAQKKVKTFIADDIAFNVELMATYIAKIKGQVVESAGNGKEAFSKFVDANQRGEKFDIILLDYGLSIRNGKEVCKLIREYETIKKLKPHLIFVLSGNYDEKFRELLTDKNGPYRFDSIIKKPIFYEELVENFANFLL